MFKNLLPASPIKIIRFALLFILAIPVISCQKELEFEQKTYEKKSSLPCDGACPHIIINIPIAKGSSVVADSINTKIFAQMKEIIFFGEDPYPAKTYEELTQQFMQSYEEAQKEFPDDVIGWEGEVKGKIYFQNERLLNIELESYTFTGGAHGYGAKRSLLFDLETGKTITLPMLIQDIPGFTKLAEQAFREKFGLAPEASINSDGFVFEDAVFKLPETFFYSDKGILLHYNTYEIASYADGAQQVFIPMTKVESFLAKQ